MSGLKHIPDELTVRELEQAAALASELFERDIERQSAVRATEELDVPTAYLARALSTLISQKNQAIARSHGIRRSAANVGIALIVAAALVGIALPFAFWASAPEHVDLSVQATQPLGQVVRPGDLSADELSRVDGSAGYLKPTTVGPVLPPASPVARGFDSHIKFVNRSDHPVSLYALESVDKAVWVTELGPSTSFVAGSCPGALWIVTDARRQPIETFTAPGVTDLTTLKPGEVNPSDGTAVITPDVIR